MLAESEEPAALHIPTRSSEIEDTISIENLASDCTILFRDCLANPRLDTAGLRLEDIGQRFDAWTRDLCMVAGGRASLDRRLKFNPDIRAMIVELLNLLKRNLTRSKIRY